MITKSACKALFKVVVGVPCMVTVAEGVAAVVAVVPVVVGVVVAVAVVAEVPHHPNTVPSQ